MMPNVKDLELSVRTHNVLAAANITSIQDFMLLTKEKVLALPNAGRKTWHEISEVQGWLERDRGAHAVAQLCKLAQMWNEQIRALNLDERAASRHMFTMDKEGYVAVWERRG